MSKRIKFKKTLGRKTKIKLKKSRSNDKRNMPNKLNQQANSKTKIKGKTIPKFFINPNPKDPEEEKDIDEPFASFECLEDINDSNLFSFPQDPLNIPEIQNAQVNDLFIENNKLP